MPFAVLLGLDNFIGLQSARVLARRNVPVIGIAVDPKLEFCRTKHVTRVYCADPKNEDQYIDTLIQVGKELNQKAVLIPCLDEYVFLLSRNRNHLATYFHVSLPEPDVLDTLVVKEKFVKLCQQEGLPAPKTFFLSQQEDAVKAANEMNFPCIVKPSARDERWWKVSKTKVNKIATAEEFLRDYQKLSQGADILIIQETIPGRDDTLYSCNCYFDKDSKPLVTFIARKIRQWPIEAGYTSLGEECKNDEVLTLSLSLLNAVPFKGLGYIEIKKSISDGKYYLIEANIGRPTGRSSLADTSGVELLYTMYCDCTGLPVPPDQKQKYTGRKWIYLTWDIRSAFSYFIRGELTLKEWWKSVQGEKTYAIFSLSDPVPFIILLLKIPVKLVSRIFKRG